MPQKQSLVMRMRKNDEWHRRSNSTWQADENRRKNCRQIRQSIWGRTPFLESLLHIINIMDERLFMKLPSQTSICENDYPWKALVKEPAEETGSPLESKCVTSPTAWARK